ncbi:hypothetical protein D3C73_1297690 [compost metagenome]
MLKAEFINKWFEVEEPSIIVTVTKLPSGALETQVNTDQLAEKYKYILENYDNAMALRRNPEVKIVGVIVA